jgi:hypothetical protein
MAYLWWMDDGEINVCVCLAAPHVLYLEEYLGLQVTTLLLYVGNWIQTRYCRSDYAG